MSDRARAGRSAPRWSEERDTCLPTPPPPATPATRATRGRSQTPGRTEPGQQPQALVRGVL